MPITVNAGSRLPGVPPQSLYGELVWRHAPAGFHAGVEVRHSGKVYVNDPNTEAAAAYTVWNLRGGLRAARAATGGSRNSCASTT